MKTLEPTDGTPMIDADLIQAFAANQAGEPIQPTVAARIKHRVLERIARAETGHKTLQATENTWQRFNHGVDIKVLHEANGIMSYLLRLAPGAVLAPHRHPVDEECVVLEGAVQIGDELVVRAGGFHLAHKDTLHAVITSEHGATIFLRGASPHIADLV